MIHKIVYLWLISASRRFANVPSLGYAFGFLLLIPFYAIVYSCLPSHFYHSTVQFEREMHDEANDILNALRDSITLNFKRYHGTNLVTRNGLVLDSDTFFVCALKPESIGVSFELQMMFRKDTDLTWELITQPRVTISLRENYSVYTPGSSEWTDFKLLTVDDGYYNAFNAIRVVAFPLQDIFPLRTEGRSIQNVPVLAIPRSLTEKIVGFVRSEKGQPITIRGRFLRMLYLSAVTITTLGYGDIVPITNTTRMLVSSEAVLGVVMIGLFLNSLALRNDERNGRVKQRPKRSK